MIRISIIDNKMNELGFEVEKLGADDLSLAPKRFAVDGDQKLWHHWNWCMFFVEGDTRPYYYCRSMKPDRYNSGNVIRMGYGPFSFQTGEHHDDMIQKDYGKIEYKKISDNPVTYQMKTESPFSCQTYTEDEFRWQEGDILDFTCKPFPATIFTHPESELGVCYSCTFVEVDGTYEGKKAHGIGVHDREYHIGGVVEGVNTEQWWSNFDSMFYVMSCIAGVREDGRRECSYASIKKHNGNGVAFYWLEGEEPILTNKPSLDTNWICPAYTPNDPTVSYGDSVWHIGPIDIHVKGIWGTKGHTFEPRLEAIGFDQGGYGPFYVGDVPYKHTAEMTFQEHVGATIDYIKDAGFEVEGY